MSFRGCYRRRAGFPGAAISLIAAKHAAKAIRGGRELR